MEGPRSVHRGGGDAPCFGLLRALALPALLSFPLLLCASAARAEWTLTTTATGGFEGIGYDEYGPWAAGGPLSDPNDLNNSCGEIWVESPEYYPGQDDSYACVLSNLTVRFRLEWTGQPGEQPAGVKDGQIKVLIHVGAGASVSASAHVHENSGGERFVGSADASAQFTSSLGNAGPVQAHAGPDGQSCSAPAVVDVSQVRTLAVNGNAAETTVDLARAIEVWECGGVAMASAGGVATLTLSIVQLANPWPAGDPVLNGDNEYVFDVAMIGAQGDVHFPYLEIPFTTNVLHGDPNALAQQGRVEWSTSRSWTAALTRLFPNYVAPTGSYIRPRCQDPYGQPFFPVGLIFGQVDNLPPSWTDFGPVTCTISVANDVNLHGPASAPAEVFFPADDNHHPGPGHLVTDNWFYYYTQLYPTSATFGPDCAGGGHSHCHTFDDRAGQIHLGDLYTHGSWRYSLRCFYLEGGAIKWAKVNDKQDWLGIRGIHQFLFTLFHEEAHLNHIQRGILIPRDTDINPWTGEVEGGEGKGDGVQWEAELYNGLNPSWLDSTGAHAGDPEADSQVLADIEAYGRLLQVEWIAPFDWADDGLQQGPRYSPDHPDYPWWYNITGNKTPCTHNGQAHLQTVVSPP